MMNNNDKLEQLCRKIALLYNDAQNSVDAMKNSSAFKLAYLISRFNHEVIKGNSVSRKNFIKWIVERKKTASLPDRHYVMRLDQTLGCLKNELLWVEPGIEELLRNTKQAELIFKQQELDKIEKIVTSFKGKTVIFFPEVVDWNIPLFQRPQQMAMAFAELDVLFFYTTPNYQDMIKGVCQVQENCYLITSEYMLDAMKIAKQNGKNSFIEIYSTDNLHFLETIALWREHCSGILYEYIDEISPEITGKVPQQTINRHNAFLKDENIFVLATADKLFNEVVSVRGSNINCLNSSNGVDVDHFMVEKDLRHVPSHIRPIIEKGKPIIGYFGAIANWFDFDMIKKAALNRPQYEFLMIGPHYGTHNLTILKELQTIPNLHFVGTVDYKTLPYVATYFSVATIPFVLNEITESTSPIKLFEYMALGKPCVTSAMRECFKYPIVKIANTHEEYICRLDEAVKESGTPEVTQELFQTALANSWKQKAKELLVLLGLNGSIPSEN